MVLVNLKSNAEEGNHKLTQRRRKQFNKSLCRIYQVHTAYQSIVLEGGGGQEGSQKGSLNPVDMILLSVAFKPEIVHVICIVLLSVLVY